MGQYYKQIADITENVGSLVHEVGVLMANQPLHIWDRQLCLTHPKDCEDPWYYGCGSRQYNTENTQKFRQYDREKPLEETDFTEVNKELKQLAVLYKLIKDIKKEHNLGRIRVMVSVRKSALTWHKDTEDRIHIPVITKEGCRMVIEDECFHMPVGGVYRVNTNGNYHSAFNGSSIDERIHIVGCVI